MRANGSIRVAPFETPTGLGDGRHAIHRRAERDGFLFCPGLVSVKAVARLRDVALAVANDLGWLDRRFRRTRAMSVAGIRLGAYDDLRWIAFLRRVLRHRAFAALRADRNILAVLEAVFGGRSTPEGGDLCRVVSGDDPRDTTVAHQDHFYLPGDTSRWTVWVPLGDCPLSLGPVAILPRSHRHGLLSHTGDSASRQAVTVAPHTVWAAQDFAAGDVLFFNWLTVHRALPNRCRRQLRLSATCRYRVAYDTTSGRRCT